MRKCRHKGTGTSLQVACIWHVPAQHCHLLLSSHTHLQRPRCLWLRLKLLKGFICIVSQHYCLRWTLGRVAAGRIEGDVRINGHPKEQSSFARVSGYVEQFDTHTAAATVKEALIFSGTLRNGKEVDMKTTTHFVDQVYPYCDAQSLVNTDCTTVCSV